MQHRVPTDQTCSTVRKNRLNRIASRNSRPWDKEVVNNNRFLIRIISLIHGVLYRATSGFIGASIGAPVLMLTTVGRKSGRSRTTPLLYLEESSNRVIVGSNAGDDRHPAWWLNLQANPVATMQIRGARMRVRARKASEREKSDLWPRFVNMHSGYQAYRQRTKRDIPVVILERETKEENAKQDL